jgi:anti-sigma factor RsiW
MTEEQITELLDLYADDALSAGLRAYVEEYLQSQPQFAQDVQSLRATIHRLQEIPAERPDPWFVERLLDRLLRDSRETLPTPAFGQHTKY